MVFFWVVVGFFGVVFSATKVGLQISRVWMWFFVGSSCLKCSFSANSRPLISVSTGTYLCYFSLLATQSRELLNIIANTCFKSNLRASLRPHVCARSYVKIIEFKEFEWSDLMGLGGQHHVPIHISIRGFTKAPVMSSEFLVVTLSIDDQSNFNLASQPAGQLEDLAGQP